MGSFDAERKLLKSDRWDEWRRSETDQKKKVPNPPLQKPAPAEGAPLIDLVPPEALTVGQMPLLDAIRRRQSRRKYAAEPLSLEELSFLLWATQGVRQMLSSNKAALRTVPSGGARHPFETYLFVNRVTGLEPGLYRYLALEHKLCCLRTAPNMAAQVARACSHEFAGNSAVTFMWTVVPYRTEWRYSFVSHKIIALDAGHVCQNLYLACEAIGAGTCAVGAYNQQALDEFLGVDGQDEFAIYVAPVGKVDPGE
jgi:SagB-type dehydrogenase family enzyme